jgi:hypothetical protein
MIDLGDHSLFARLTPSLERVDLGFNQLTEVDGLNGLPNLTHISLGFNRLTALPLLYAEAKPTSLHYPHNGLENLSGLETMTSLTEVDFSWNMLMHHDALAPISLLTKLLVLNLQGNPFTAKFDHRFQSAQWLNPGVNGEIFLLDGTALTAREKARIGLSRLVPNTPSTAPLSRTSTDSGVGRKKAGQAAANREMESSVVSVVSGGGVKGKRGSRRRAVAREAVIAEPKNDEQIEKERHDMLSGAAAKQTNQGQDTQYLETKRKIEELRRKYGEEDWLHSAGADQVHVVLGIEKSDPRTVTEIVAQRLADKKADREDKESRKADINKFVEQAVASVAAARQQKTATNNLSSTDEDSFEDKLRARERELKQQKLDQSEKDDGATYKESAKEENEEESASGGEKMKKKLSATEEMTASFYSMYNKTEDKADDEKTGKMRT